MRQYPIYNIVTACIYKNGTPTSWHTGSKSYGVKETGDVEVRVGTSSKNSHTFLNTLQRIAYWITAIENIVFILTGK